LAPRRSQGAGLSSRIRGFGAAAPDRLDGPFAAEGLKHAPESADAWWSMQADREQVKPVWLDVDEMRHALAAELPGAAALALSAETLRERASIAFEWGVEGHDDVRVVRHLLAIELLSAASPDLISDIAAARRVVERLEEGSGVHPAVIARGILRSPQVLAVAPQVAIPMQLALMMVLGPIDELSLWRRDHDGKPQRIGSVGEEQPTDPAVAKLALTLLRGESARKVRGELVALPFEDSDGRPAVIVSRSEPVFHDRVRTLMTEGIPILVALLDREALLTRTLEMERALADKRDRRLTRLGLDVHDGPLQDIAALAQDIALFRKQLRRVLDGHDRRDLLLGRVDDFEAQLVAVDSEIRRLAISLQSPFLSHQDFLRALRELVDSFTVAAGIAPELTISGDLRIVSESQQMALLSIVRESLNNIREHTQATEIRISITADHAGVTATVRDNGAGFDIESTLLRSARDGHLGLVGMQERVRLLDGHSRIDSRPGGPTTVTIELQRWQPLH
jgi:signal transduction histidine kinase